MKKQQTTITKNSDGLYSLVLVFILGFVSWIGLRFLEYLAEGSLTLS